MHAEMTARPENWLRGGLFAQNWLHGGYFAQLLHAELAAPQNWLHGGYFAQVRLPAPFKFYALLILPVPLSWYFTPEELAAPQRATARRIGCTAGFLQVGLPAALKFCRAGRPTCAVQNLRTANLPCVIPPLRAELTARRVFRAELAASQLLTEMTARPENWLRGEFFAQVGLPAPFKICALLIFPASFRHCTHNWLHGGYFAQLLHAELAAPQNWLHGRYFARNWLHGRYFAQVGFPAPRKFCHAANFACAIELPHAKLAARRVFRAANLSRRKD
ncbi:hypothetical protein FB451DRAFT_1422956 [Mycena latifolia]|nr:hypothetical protein FB451DRAFT_1422956 [Mycena latifolia]